MLCCTPESSAELSARCQQRRETEITKKPLFCWLLALVSVGLKGYTERGAGSGQLVALCLHQQGDLSLRGVCLALSPSPGIHTDGLCFPSRQTCPFSLGFNA